VAAIPDPEFVFNLTVAQEDMQCGIAFVQEIIVTAINIEANLLDLFFMVS